MTKPTEPAYRRTSWFDTDAGPNGAHLGDELRALRDTLGLTELGRAFMTKHAEIFGDARVPTPAQDATALADELAQWLHDETNHPESYPNHTWPETERDDGQRDGGFVKIVPLHGQEYFRDIARRLIARFPALRAAPQTPDAVREALEAALPILSEYDFPGAHPHRKAVYLQVKAEAVAWRYQHANSEDPSVWHMLKDGTDPTKWLASFGGEYNIQPLYAHPQPQQAVALQSPATDTATKEKK